MLKLIYHQGHSVNIFNMLYCLMNMSFLILMGDCVCISGFHHHLVPKEQTAIQRSILFLLLMKNRSTYVELE